MRQTSTCLLKMSEFEKREGESAKDWLMRCVGSGASDAVLISVQLVIRQERRDGDEVSSYHNIFHMQSNRVRRVNFPASYQAFLVNCTKAFECELAQYGTNFRVYRLPYLMTVNIGDLKKAITQEDYPTLRRDVCFNEHEPTPLVLIWSVSDVELSSDTSGRVKKYNEYHCMACNHKYTQHNDEDQLEVGHLLGCDEVNCLSASEADAVAESCELVGANQVRNKIPLCTTCQKHFDLHELGIEMVGQKYVWLVKPQIEDIIMPHSTAAYGTLRGQEIVFRHRGARPPPELIEYRLLRYRTAAGTSSRGTKRKVMSKEEVAGELNGIGCSDQFIDALWNEREIREVKRASKRPRKNDSDWEQIQPTVVEHAESASFWYNAKLGRLWVKCKSG